MLPELLSVKDDSLVGDWRRIGDVEWMSSTVDVGSWKGILVFVEDNVCRVCSNIEGVGGGRCWWCCCDVTCALGVSGATVF
jgi:hypothetical protein